MVTTMGVQLTWLFVVLALSVNGIPVKDHSTAVQPAGESQQTKIDLRMPGVQPKLKDTYLCTSMKLGDHNQYLTGFEPHASMKTAHHILLYGCSEPGEDTNTWNCGEMMSKNNEKSGPVCASGSQIIYAWAMDAPSLTLPKGVAFKIGGNTMIKYLVLQVHYKNVEHFLPPENKKDASGLTLITTSEPQPRLAGVYLLASSGVIKPHSTVYMETACSVHDPVTLHPFAYRVHAHSHGKVVSGYRIRDGNWTEIGRMSPQKPQMFYNVTHAGLTIEKGDSLAARCTMVNDEDRTVETGFTQRDEMCNFYVMYWTDAPHSTDDSIGHDEKRSSIKQELQTRESLCLSPGPPTYSWSLVRQLHVGNVPSDASIVPGSLQPLISSEEAEIRRVEQEQAQLQRQFLDLLSRYDSSFDVAPPVNDPQENYFGERRPIGGEGQEYGIEGREYREQYYPVNGPAYESSGRTYYQRPAEEQSYEPNEIQAKQRLYGEGEFDSY